MYHKNSKVEWCYAIITFLTTKASVLSSQNRWPPSHTPPPLNVEYEKVEKLHRDFGDMNKPNSKINIFVRFS